ncbi:tetratricopeptide repeat protein [Hellea sp.]|nr:tetratricopeptide repeat protein [Hellea sp.]
MKQFVLFLLAILLSSHSFANEVTSKPNEQLQGIIDLFQGDSHEDALNQLKLKEEDLAAFVSESKDAEIYMLLGCVYFYAEMDTKAIETFKSALQLAPSLSDAYFYIGLINQYADNLDGAEESFRDAIALNSNDEKYFVSLGRTHEMQDNLASASIAYKKALALNSGNFDANFNLATIYAIAGDASSAKKYYLAAIEQKPNDVDSHYNLGQLYQNKSQHELAINQFKKVVELNPNEWRALAKLVQENEAIKDYPARDFAIEKIYDVWRENADEELKEQRFYIREQSELENGKLFVLEYFELEGERARKFVFKLQDEKTEDFKFEVSLGSYDGTTAISRELGEIGPDERIYHLDGYAPNGSHFTYAFFNTIPPYEAVKEIALKKLAGENKSISSTIISGESEATIYIDSEK